MSLPLSSVENIIDSGDPVVARKRRKEASRRAAGGEDANEMDLDGGEVVPQTPESNAAAENADRVYFSEDDNEENQPRKRIKGGPGQIADPQSDDVQMRDSGYEEGEATAHLTQAKATKDRRTLKPGPPGTVGRIELSNIMCHANLVLDFCGNVNFVTGQNGSGKSSILAALMVALGGRVTATSRGTSNSSIIKDGSSWGESVIYLRNSGEDAFRSDTYGDHIRIVRRIVRNGAATYKIQNSEGDTISTKRSDLQDILDHYGIDVSNPLCVLTQENAKKFLANSSDEDKYRFFLLGTNLHSLKYDIEHLKARAETVCNTMPDFVSNVEHCKRRQEDAERRQELISKSKPLEQEIEDLKHQIAWSEIEEAEVEVEKKDAELRKHKSALENILTVQAEQEAKMNPIQDQLTAIDMELREVATEISQATEQRKERDRALQEAEELHATAVQDIKEMNVTTKEKKLELDFIKNAMREAAERSSGPNKDHLLQLQQRETELEGELHAIEENLETARQTQAQLDDDMSGMEQSIKDAETDESQLKKELSGHRRYLGELSGRSANDLAAFGWGVREVLAEIDKQSRSWTGQKPIGPVGKFVKLKDPTWSRVIEGNLGGTLNAFVVETWDDEDRLRAILRQFRCRSSIFRVKWNSFDTRRFEPEDQFITIMRVLEIEHEIVRKVLVINNRIEAQVLVRSRAEGNQLYERYGLKYPHNVVSIITSENYQIGSRNGGWSSSANPEWKKGRRLVADLSQQRDEAQTAVQDCERKLAEIGQAVGQLRAQKQSHEQQKNQVLFDIRSLEGQMRKIQRGLNDVREELQEKVESVDISGMQDEQRRLEAELEEIRVQFSSSQVTVDKLKEAAVAVKNALQDVTRSLELMNRKAADFADDKGTVQRDLQKVVDYLEQLHPRKVGAETFVVRTEGELEDMRKMLETKIEGATEICDRVEVTMERKRLDKAVRDKEALLREQMRDIGSHEEVERELENAKDALSEALKNQYYMENLATALKKSIELRVSGWNDLRQKVAYRAAANFSAAVEKHGRTGKLTFTHSFKDSGTGQERNGALSINIVTDRSSATSETQRGTNTLSGGEKSFSQICLLVSLWETMSSPIRCLDEFDVFMDSITRGISMNNLAEAARGLNNTQFIFISPQDMSALRIIDPKNQRVVRLPDPVRGGQQRLNFGATQ